MTPARSAGHPRRRYSIDGHDFGADPLVPGLYVAATPIGNLADVTLRALAVLASADTILCEDTRTTRKLVSRYGIATPLRAYHDHNAAKVRPAVLDRLRGGDAIALVSDAGTPLISDPGFKLVREAREAGIAVYTVPGASAPLAALSIAGLPSDRFLFAGFLPSKAGERRRALQGLREIQATVVLFESPQRIGAALRDIAEVLGEREVAVARELTKIHEEVLTGHADTLAATLAERDGLRGEITLLIAPPAAAVPGEVDEAVLDEEIAVALATMPAGRAAAHVARITGLPRKSVYARMLALKDSADDRPPPRGE